MFWIIAVLLIILALAIILPPLLKDTQVEVNPRRDQNIQIAKEQLAELETAFANNEMRQEDYLARRDELEQALYSDTSNDDAITTQFTKPSIISTGLIALIIPMIAFAMYAQYGDINALDPEKAKTAKKMPMTADGKPDIDAMVSGLRKKLEANPDPEGWYMLGRSYMALNRFEDAAYSYEQLAKLEPNDAKVMLFLADALSMKNNGNLSGRPTALIEKSLTLEPKSVTGLWLGGMSASQQGDHLKAIRRWITLIPLLSKQPDQVIEIHKMIAESKKKLSPEALASLPAMPKMPAMPITDTALKIEKIAKESSTEKTTTPKSIVVSISLSDNFKDKVQPTDTVFIYAKAMAGPPMPLAAKRIQVKDLPITLTLDDSMAMMPKMRISNFPKVVIGARISKNGNAIGVNGDLYSEKRDIVLGTTQTLVIDSVLQK